MPSLPWRDGPAELHSDSLTSWKGQDDARAQILTMSGHCPRCGDHSTWEIHASTVVVTASAEIAIGSRDAGIQYRAATLFTCLCETRHEHPATLRVTGCGAFWVARPKKHTDGTFTLEPVTDAGLIKAASLVAKESESVESGLRTLAEKWVPGVAAMISVLGLAGVVVSKDAVDGLSQGWRIAAAVLVAGAVMAAATATALVYRAAFGWPQTVSLETDADLLAAARKLNDRTTTIAGRLRDSVVLSGVAVLALLGGLFIFWLQPDSTRPIKVTFTESGGSESVCGTAGDVNDGKLSVEISEGSTTSTRQVSLSAVTKIDQVSSCGG